MKHTYTIAVFLDGKSIETLVVQYKSRTALYDKISEVQRRYAKAYRIILNCEGVYEDEFTGCSHLLYQ